MSPLCRFLGGCLIAALLTGRNAHAGSVTVPNSFTANTAAVAADVNADFSAVAGGVNGNASDIAALQSALATVQSQLASLQSTLSDQADTIASLQATVDSQTSTIASLQSDLSDVQNSNVMALDPYLDIVEVSDPVNNSTTYPTVQFSGLNVQIVNGTGYTNTLNGLGNLIIGYNEYAGTVAFCSNGDYDNQSDCENNAGTWAANQRSGSHNLILGDRNAYSRYGSLVAGVNNIVNGVFTSVSGGKNNIADHSYAAVSGGSNNSASGDYASVSGGYLNTASGDSASVCGGELNKASGNVSSIGGGEHNTASGAWSSVSGGNGRETFNFDDWAAGSLYEDF